MTIGSRSTINYNVNTTTALLYPVKIIIYPVIFVG